MIPDEKRQAILLWAKQGVKIRDICRKMDVSRNTVRNVIRHPELKPVHPPGEPLLLRNSPSEHDAQLLIWIRDAFTACRSHHAGDGVICSHLRL